MGQAKKLKTEWDERLYGPVDDRAVCPSHIHDDWLAKRVAESADAQCTYCGADGAANLEEVMPYVMEAVRGYYVRAIEHVHWHELSGAADGEEVLASIADGDFDDEVALDIAEALSHNDERWTPLWEHRHGWLGAGWDRFCRWVITKSRFLLEPPTEEDFEPGEQPQKMLGAVGKLILREGLIESLPARTKVYRARTLPEGTRFRAAHELSAPPAELAKPGRMNPLGIPFFYGALDAETAAIEVYDGNMTAGVAEFETIAPLSVVDLTSLPPLPSIFDAEQRSRRDQLMFLAGFAEYIARPIDRNGREDLAYLPSQAVTEYFRLSMPARIGTPVHGLLFRSSRVGQQSPFVPGDSKPHEGVNIVLFCGAHGGLDDDQVPGGDVLERLRCEDQWLRLPKEVVTRYEYGPPRGSWVGQESLQDK